MCLCMCFQFMFRLRFLFRLLLFGTFFGYFEWATAVFYINAYTTDDKLYTQG